jgi:hypothetical protein
MSDIEGKAAREAASEWWAASEFQWDERHGWWAGIATQQERSAVERAGAGKNLAIFLAAPNCLSKSANPRRARTLALAFDGA